MDIWSPGWDIDASQQNPQQQQQQQPQQQKQKRKQQKQQQKQQKRKQQQKHPPPPQQPVQPPSHAGSIRWTIAGALSPCHPPTRPDRSGSGSQSTNSCRSFASSFCVLFPFQNLPFKTSCTNAP
ncbi:hypothetical protein E4U54_004564 [Claviceps lovelessii]|nr:hypothetical protein E4U54_004564 [Claviceps lovelessii]